MKQRNLYKQRSWSDLMELNYGTPEITLVRGKGVYVWDEAGKKYLDFLGGIATNLLGHADPAIVKAVTDQVQTLAHTSNLYAHPSALALADKLQSFLPVTSRVFFCNSGAEANEAALKISRLTGRNRIISTIGGFHGRTMGALSLTGQPSKRAPFLPLLRGVDFVKYGDIRELEKTISKKTAMVILEPIQGENGVVVPPVGYLKAVRELCDRYGVLLCIDAVQTGVGRTGHWFGFEHEGITPDIITLAKGLGGGLPLGAMMTVGDRVPHFSAGQHGSTFGGNPISAAAGIAAISVIEKKKLLKKATLSYSKIANGLSRVPGVQSVRGKGLLIGIVLHEKVAHEVARLAALNGLLINAPAPDVIRLAPALIVNDVQIQEFLRKFSQTMEMVKNG